jgi:hypothetical protein
MLFGSMQVAPHLDAVDGAITAIIAQNRPHFNQGKLSLQAIAQ